MAGNMKAVKLRIKSVQSTMQITKAMELVASSKLRKAKERAEVCRPYFETMHKTLADIAQSNTDFTSVYVKEAVNEKRCYVLIAGDRGLAGGYNTNLYGDNRTASYLQGDINNDGKIDRNDLTSYMNYTGLRRGDSDYEGYISKGDINMNDLIDAYDISVVATQLEGGVGRKDTLKVSGSLSISTPKRLYQKDEIVEIRVKGNDLKAVNALSFALPYDQNDFEFVGVEPLNMKAMENLTYDRLHTNGVKSLYPTFVNIGKQEALNGSEELFVLKLKAKRKVKFELTLKDGILVDKELRMHQF